MKCPLTTDGVHVITGAVNRCACGYQLQFARLSLSIEVYDKSTMLINEHFSTDRIEGVVAALREAADKLDVLAMFGRDAETTRTA